MLNKKILSIIFVACLIGSALTFAENLSKSEEKNVEFEEIVSKYRAYSSSILPEVRDEIIGYRKSISDLNKQKREFYLKLSQKAQDYLAKEQEYRKKLPINYKKQVNLGKGTSGK